MSGNGRADSVWRLAGAEALRLCAVLVLLLAALLHLPCRAAAAATSSGPQVQLSDEERAWLRRHPVVRVVAVRNAEPYYTVARGATAQPVGYGIDLLNLMAERAGMTLHYEVVDTFEQMVAKLRDGSADLTPLAAPSPERLDAMSFPGPLIDLEWVLVSRKDMADISGQQNFAGRRIAVVEAQVPGAMLAKAYPAADARRYPDTPAALRAVAVGEVDLAVGWLHRMLYGIETQFLANLEVRRQQHAPRSYLGPAVTLAEPMLHGIVAKAMGSLSPAERSEAARRWLPEGGAVSWGATPATLSAEQRNWVQLHGDLRVGFDRAFAPFAMGDGLGRFEGLGADALRLAAAKVGLRVVEQRGSAFADAIAGARSGALNVVVGMARNPERLSEFEFIGPFASSPTVMVMRVNDQRVWRRPEDIPAGRIGLLREHFLIPRLQSRQPSLTLQAFEDQADALDAVASGEVDVAFGNAAVMGRLIETRHVGRLQFTGVVPDGDSELFFAVPKRDPELARVLRLGFDAIMPGEQAEMRQRWLTVSVRPGIGWQDVLRWVVPAGLAALVALGTLWFANRRLAAAHARERSAREEAMEAVAARGRFLAYLSHELRSAAGALSNGARLMQASADPQLQRRLLSAMHDSGRQLLSLLESTLEHERQLVAGSMLQPTEQSLADWWAGVLAPHRISAIEKGLDLHEEAPPDLLLRFDGVRLGQALGNLIQNAIRFTAKGTVEVRGSCDGTQLWLRVQDEGPGIADDEREAIFKPYRQGQAAQAVGKGAGLGLAIARQIVEGMGGQLTLEPGTGRGAAFSLVVPVCTVAGGVPSQSHADALP